MTSSPAVIARPGSFSQAVAVFPDIIPPRPVDMIDRRSGYRVHEDPGQQRPGADQQKVSACESDRSLSRSMCAGEDRSEKKWVPGMETADRGGYAFWPVLERVVIAYPLIGLSGIGSNKRLSVLGHWKKL
ncbi:hypothetical protein D4S03_09250 [bacterium]|nr:MAG: hypothetical protein D4S03_09250 [bacterium]